MSNVIRITNNTCSSHLTAITVASFATFWAGPANAQWEFELVADLGVIHSDNISLEPEGLEVSETIYTIAPTFGLTSDSGRVNADIRYRAEAYFYNDTPDSDAVYHILDANLTLTLMDEALYLYTSAVNYQTIVSPNLALPTTNVPLTGNRVDSRVLEVRPYWEQNLGFASVLAEVGFIDEKYDARSNDLGGLIQDNDEIVGRFTLDNHANQRGVAWGVDYQYRKLEYEDALPWEYQMASANLGYWFNEVVRVFGSGGAETPFDSFFDSAMDDEFWEFGFQYRPNQRIDIELAAGERGYGDSYRGRISYSFRRGRTELSYDEGLTTSGELGFDRRPFAAGDSLNNLLDQPARTDRFLSKRSEWQTNIELAKSAMSLRVFSDQRIERTTDSGLPLADEDYAGVAFRWSWSLGANSQLGINADLARRETAVSESDLSRYSVDFSIRFSRRLSLALLAQRSEEDGLGPLLSNYVENQFRITLQTEIL